MRLQGVDWRRVEENGSLGKAIEQNKGERSIYLKWKTTQSTVWYTVVSWVHDELQKDTFKSWLPECMIEFGSKAFEDIKHNTLI